MKVTNRGQATLMIGKTLINGGETKIIDSATFERFKRTEVGQWYLKHRLEVSDDTPVQPQKKKPHKKTEENSTKKEQANTLNISM